MALKRIPINSASARICAFCKHYYDPAGTVIRPVPKAKGLWEYESRAYMVCTNKSCKMYAYAKCANFESKL